MSLGRSVWTIRLVACVAMGMALAGGAALAQGRRGGSRQSGPPAAAETDPPTPAKPAPPPTQRLDPGALLCRTEAELQQHQEAVAARLDGRQGQEPVGCRMMRAATPVAVLDRHGIARTQVRVPGPPQLIGWTDAIVRDQAAAR